MVIYIFVDLSPSATPSKPQYHNSSPAYEHSSQYSCFERLSSSPGCSPTLPSTRRVRLSAAVGSLLLFTAGLEAVQATAASSPTSLPLAAYYTCAYADTALQYCVPAIGYAAPYAFSLAAAAYAARHRRARAPATAASADIYRLIVVLALPATQAPFLIGQRLAAAAAGSRQPRYSSGLAVAVTLLRFSQPLVLPLVAGAAWLRGVGRPRSPQRLRGSPLAASGRLTLYADAGGLRLMNDASATSATSACDTPSPSTGTTSTTIATTIATIATTTTATTTAATPSDGDAETYPQCLRSSSELRTCSDADDDDNSGLSARTVSPIRSKRKKSANYLSKMIANVDRADAPDVVPTADLPSARSRRDRGSDVDGNASRPQIKKKKKRYRQPTCVENISGEADRAERGECSGEGQFEDCDDDNSLRRLPADLSTQPLSGALSQQLASSSPEGPTTAFSQPQTLSTPAPRICKQDSPTPQLDANETQSHFKKKTKKRKRTKFKKHVNNNNFNYVFSFPIANTIFIVNKSVFKCLILFY